MPVSISNTSKGTPQSLDNALKRQGSGLTWDEMTWSWDEETGTWDQGGQYTLSKESKSSQSISNEAKN